MFSRPSSAIRRRRLEIHRQFPAGIGEFLEIFVNAAMGEIFQLAQQRTIVVGAGIGGLVAAAVLAREGCEVTVVEKAAAPGGKIRALDAGGRPIDAGPTVFTMRPLFEEIAEAAGFDLATALRLIPVEALARHAWSETERLDLFVDPERSADAIGAFAGPDEARRFLAFRDEAAHVFRTLDRPFIRAPTPSMGRLVLGAGLSGLADLARIKPFATLWSSLGQAFGDPRLQQLFGRYATYCGSNPYAAPATLMLVAHVEMAGVWLVDGGMARLAQAFAARAEANGAQLRYGAEVASIDVAGGRASGVTLSSGERIEAGSVVFNGDVAALGAGLLGAAPARAGAKVKPSDRSLSAVTICRNAKTSGFPLARHTVFFSDDYAAEFADIFDHSRLPERPTVYVCAQDRDDCGRLLDGVPEGAPERLMLLVNAPPIGDAYSFGREEIARCELNAMALLERCGLTVEPSGQASAITTPTEFAKLFPGTGGALYGAASHGPTASFKRPGAKTSLKGLYLCGGSAHPGPGIPMAALSGWQAAKSLIADHASTGRSRRTATPGGMSTPGATTDRVA